MTQPFHPKRVETKQPRGPGTKSVLPRYVAKGNAKKVARTIEWDLFPGEVYADVDADGKLIGVEVI